MLTFYITADFNMEIYRLNFDGSQGLIIPYIGLTFENMKQFNECGYLDGDGDFASDKAVISTFNDVIATPLNFHTLAQIGTKVESSYTNIKYLPFAPSIENLSIYLYNILKPIYARKHINLVATHVKDAMFITCYPKVY